MRSPNNAVPAAHERAPPRLARAGTTTSPHCYPSATTTPPRAAPMTLAKPSLMLIPTQRTPEPSTLKGMHPVRSYGSTRGVRPTPRHFPNMERSSLIPSQDTQLAESTDPGAELGRPDGKACHPDTQDASQRSPYPGTQHSRSGPKQHHRDPSNTAHTSRSYSFPHIT